MQEKPVSFAVSGFVSPIFPPSIMGLKSASVTVAAMKTPTCKRVESIIIFVNEWLVPGKYSPIRVRTHADTGRGKVHKTKENPKLG